MSVEKLLSEFDELADKKLQSRVVKYGELVGDSPMDLLDAHMIEEFAEWFYAVYGDNWRDGVVYMVSEIIRRAETEKSRDVVTELFDLRNMARVTYVNGKMQGLF